MCFRIFAVKSGNKVSRSCTSSLCLCESVCVVCVVVVVCVGSVSVFCFLFSISCDVLCVVQVFYFLWSAFLPCGNAFLCVVSPFFA